MYTPRTLNVDTANANCYFYYYYYYYYYYDYYYYCQCYNYNYKFGTHFLHTFNYSPFCLKFCCHDNDGRLG